MNIENIIRVWKADEDHWEVAALASPVGQELTEEELLQVNGGLCIANTTCTLTNCVDTCNTITCRGTCGVTMCITTTIA